MRQAGLFASKVPRYATPRYDMCMSCRQKQPGSAAGLALGVAYVRRARPAIKNCFRYTGRARPAIKNYFGYTGRARPAIKNYFGYTRRARPATKKPLRSIRRARPVVLKGL
jgi:hypothetical protein